LLERKSERRKGQMTRQVFPPPIDYARPWSNEDFPPPIPERIFPKSPKFRIIELEDEEEPPKKRQKTKRRRDKYTELDPSELEPKPKKKRRKHG
jgi:hypothetical protein